MKVRRLSLRQFTVFHETDIDFSPGLNVLIGTNGSGKSHVLKVAYSIQKAVDHSLLNPNISCDQLVKTTTFNVLVKLAAVFKTSKSNLTSLIERTHSAGFFQLRLVAESYRLNVEANIFGGADTKFECDNRNRCQAILVPSRDVLALYEGFIAAYEKRELSFDESYFDLCVALSSTKLKTNGNVWWKEIAERVQPVLGGEIELRDGRFYVDNFEAHLVAEGWRKLAMLVWLLETGVITPEVTLYWDEPEAGLNPKLIKVVADVLLVLAAKGVQVILATHDALLTQELSIAAEYETDLGRAAQLRYFCLDRTNPKSPVSVQTGATLAEIEHNPILEEFAAHYDRERRLFVGDDANASGAK